MPASARFPSHPRTHRRRHAARCVCAALGVFAAAATLHAQMESAARNLLLDARRTGDTIVAVGERGAILRSVDSGQSWEAVRDTTRATLTAVSFAPHSLEGWAVGHDATLLATHDGGISWSPCYHNPDPSQSFLDVLALDTNDVIAVGAFGFAVATHDAGRSWQSVKVEAGDFHLNALCKVGPDLVLVVGEAGFAAVSGDSGRSWSPLRSPYDGSFFGAAPLGSSGALVLGLRGHLYRIGDVRHPVWSELPTPPGCGLLCTGLRLRDGTWVAAGRGRSFLVSHDGAASFAAWDPGVATDVARLVQAPDGTLLAVGEAGVSRLPNP